MSWIGRKMHETATLFGMSGTASPGSNFWYNPVGSLSNSGQNVSHASALSSSVVYAAIKIISGSIASLPLKTYRRLENGDKTELPEHPLYTILHDQANEESTAQEFRETMTAYALWRGTAFADIVQGSRGPIDQLIPIHPDHIKPVQTRDNAGRSRLVFEVRKNGEPVRRILREELFIYRALVLEPDGILGIDPIMAEANAIGARIASQDYGARFFENDAQAGMIIKHPANFKSKEDRDRFIEGWQRSSVGANRHRTRVLEFGMEPESITMTNEQSQFLETQKYQDFDIARIFNIPPHKVGILERNATFSNIEQQAIEFVQDTLMPWAVRWHQCVKRDLIRQPTIFVEHSFGALLRGDTEQRFRAYAIARNWGWQSANDIRRKENENSIGPEGDTYLQPLNMVPAGAPGEPSGMGQPAAVSDELLIDASARKPNGKAKWDVNQASLDLAPRED